MGAMWIVVGLLIVIAPAVIYQIGTFMKEMRQQRLEEMEKRSELDSKILGLDTSSTEIKVELAELRKEIAELKRIVTGGGQVRAAQSESLSEAQEQHRETETN